MVLYYYRGTAGIYHYSSGCAVTVVSGTVTVWVAEAAVSAGAARPCDAAAAAACHRADVVVVVAGEAADAAPASRRRCYGNREPVAPPCGTGY